MYAFLVKFVVPSGPVILRSTPYEPEDTYTWDGFWSVDIFPSPNVHNHEVLYPVESSVNDTFNGIPPVVGTPVKSADKVEFAIIVASFVEVKSYVVFRIVRLAI